MTPARTHGNRGNYIINRRFKNVGLIKKSLNTTNLGKYRFRVALIEKLHKLEQYELLREFARKRSKISIEYLVELELRGDLGLGLSSLKLRENLWDAIERQLPTLAESEATTRRYATSFRALQRKARNYLGDRATVADLEGVNWRKLKAEWKASGTDWMHMRRAVGRFLTIHLGDVYHPFRRKIVKAIPTARIHKRKPSLSLEQFQEILAQVPEEARPAYWCIVATGMRDGEYIACRREHLNSSTRTLFIPGRKTDESEALVVIDARLWPLVASAIPPRYAIRYYQDKWAAAVKAAKLPRVTIHDLRHVHGQWAINAGVPESMVQGSLRHKAAGQTRDYVMQRDTGVVSAALADLLTTPKRRRA